MGAARSTTRGRHTTRSLARSSASTYAPPLVLHSPLLGRAPAQDLSPAVPTAAVPQEPAVPMPVDEGDVRTVAQQLARGGSALQFPGALGHFFVTLRARENQPGNSTVRVLQFGDSHTAADMFTGEARARMQARFGDGGVGFSYAGHPFAGYRILGSGRGQTGGWTTLGTHFTQLGDAELGMGGVAIQSSHAGESASLDAPCLTLQVEYLRQPGGGTFQLNDNGMPVQAVSTSSGAADPATTTDSNGIGTTDAYPLQSADNAAASPRSTGSIYSADRRSSPATTQTTPPLPADTVSSAGTLRYDCAAGTHHFTMTSQGNGPVRLLGTVALQPGITWEAMGINGAEAPLMLRWNQPVFRSFLAASMPDLIVLAYGTNEAAAHWTGEEYRATFTRLIDMLHRTAPAASILVVGPADRSLGSTTYTVVGRGRRARRIAHRYFTPYSGTARIINAQRDVCSTHNCTFWDWQQRQGGLGAMNRWVSAGYAQPDHTHFTGTGYHALADALVADLLSAYSGYVPRVTAANN